MLYIVAHAGTVGNQLWKSDGTSAGTQLVYDFGNNGYPPLIHHLQSVNGLLYFTVWTAQNGRELWRTDGTTAATFVVKDINPATWDDQGPDYLTAFNNRLYFTADDGSGRKLWMTNMQGTSADLVVPGNNILVMNTWSNYGVNTPLPVSNNKLYFQGYTGATGNELYKYDVVNGITLVKDITPGTASTNLPFFDAMVDVSNTLYFRLINSNGRDELWKTTGTSASTAQIRVFDSSEDIFNLSACNNKLLFGGYDTLHSYELWVSDGTTSGTSLLKDIYKGKTGSNPYPFTPVNNKVFFLVHVLNQKGLNYG